MLGQGLHDLVLGVIEVLQRRACRGHRAILMSFENSPIVASCVLCANAMPKVHPNNHLASGRFRRCDVPERYFAGGLLVRRLQRAL